MTIIHVDTGMELRGGQRQLLLLARRLRERGHEQLIVCPEGSRLAARAQQENFPVAGWLGSYSRLAQFQRRVESRPPDIVHAHDGRGQTLAWMVSRRTEARRVAHRRVTFVPRAWNGGKLIHRLKYTRTCHAVIAVSDFIRHILLQCGVPEAMIAVIPDGVDLPETLPDAGARRRIRHRWGFDDDRLVLGTLGSLTPEKGLDVALDAARLLEKRLPEARFLVPVSGPAVLPRRVPANVRIVDYVEHLDDFLPALDLFLMPSRDEGLGSAALLALSYGVPVVASRVGGLPEIVEEGYTGWLVCPGSPGELAEAVERAAQDRQRLEAFARHARVRAAAFSSDIMTERVLKLYAKLLHRDSDGSSLPP
jgi:glycosyltransferase involved in cell wall biosynthesis